MTAEQGAGDVETCASCGQPSMHKIMMRDVPVPVCLRHLNVWRTPDWLASLLAATADSARAHERAKVAGGIARALIAERNARVLHSPAWFAFDDAAHIARDGGR